MNILVIIFTVIFMIFTVINIKTVSKARKIQQENENITYWYDPDNHTGEQITAEKSVISSFTADNVTETDGVYHVSFRCAFFGTLKIIFPEKTRTELKLTLTFSEIDADGKAWTRKDSSRSLHGYGIIFHKTAVNIPCGTSEYIVEMPERPLPARITVPDNFKGGVVPFRVCTVEGYSGLPLDRSSFVQLAMHTPFNWDASCFECSDRLINRIYELCRDTVVSTSFAGVYIDGFRELRPYEADVYINELSHFAEDNNYNTAANTIEFLLRHHTWPTEWVQQTVNAAYEYYMYSGDKDFIERNFSGLQKCLLEPLLNNDGLIDSSLSDKSFLESLGLSYINDIIDWPCTERDGFAVQKNNPAKQTMKTYSDNLKNKYCGFIADIAGYHYAAAQFKIWSGGMAGNNRIASDNAVVNAFYYSGLMRMSFLAAEIGKNDLKELYGKKAEQFAEIYRKAFISTATGLVKDTPDSEHSSLHANMFALNFGLVPDKNKPEVIGFIKSKGMACSVYGAQYLLEALAKENEFEHIFRLITDKGTKSWYNMLRMGSTLTTEAWDESIKPNMDWNHAWGTAPLNIIARYIAGIRPSEPGCGKIISAPNFGSLTGCKMKVPLKTGIVTIDYRRENDTVCEKISLPVSADFIFPSEMLPHSAAINGRQIEHIDKAGRSSIILEKGTYEIVWKNCR